MKAHDFGFEICGGQLGAKVGANGTWTAKAVQTLTSADLNTWKHAAMTYDGTSVRLYINGALINTAAGAHTTTERSASLWPLEPSVRYWNGMIDEVRLSPGALPVRDSGRHEYAYWRGNGEQARRR